LNIAPLNRGKSPTACSIFLSKFPITARQLKSTVIICGEFGEKAIAPPLKAVLNSIGKIQRYYGYETVE
jgi:hypothetical protein